MTKSTLFSAQLTPPSAEKRPVRITAHDRVRTDPYAWMKDENWQAVMDDPSLLSADIRSHLEAENAYTAAQMDDTKALQKTLFAEMKGRIKDDDSSVPQPDGPYLYADRFRPGDQHGITYRARKDDPSAREDIILDGDALAAAAKAAGYPFFDIEAAGHSDDHKTFAYAADLTGAERCTITVFDIESRENRIAPIENTSGDFEFSKDGNTLFYVERDESNRPSKVYRQNLLDTSAKPVLIYTEADAGFFVGLSRSDTGGYIEIHCHDHTTSETLLIPADTPDTAPKIATPRSNGREYSLHDHGDDFYVLTNAGGATDFKIMRTPQSGPGAENWQEFIPHTPGVLILGTETYARNLVRIERENALPRIVIRELSSGQEHAIAFDQDAYALGLEGGYEFDTDWLRFSYSSPSAPNQVFDYNMQTRERILRKTTEVPSGHQSDDYSVGRIDITARDGEQIPVTIIMQAGQKLDGSAPCLLYGYGSYGITIPASFRTSILSLVDRGFIYAIAHIRGGKAKGYDWYTKGKLENKQSTFDDFIDTGRALAAQNYTRKGKIIGHGGSAGGLLMGAALNQDPALFGGIIAAVPFVDVLNTMSDASLPLTPPEWPEWGNPVESADNYDRIAAYSPYDNVKDTAYPPVLITAGLTDPRVTYWEPAKWAACLRDHQTGPAPILLRTNMEAGHQGEAGRYDALKETAFEYAFAIKAAGLG